MKEKLGIILLVVVLLVIGVFLGFIIISKQDLKKEEFNIKEGEVLKFDEEEVTLTVLNVASTLCEEKDCISKGEIEVSLKASYNGEDTYYTLKNVSKSAERIKNSNYYIVLSYIDKKINLEIKDKSEM